MALLSSDLRSARIQEFQGKMSEYLKNRQSGRRNTTSFFTRFFDEIIGTDPNTATHENGTLTIFGRFTLKNKRDVITKINHELSGREVTYTETDIEAARDGDLGKILEQYETILPNRFKKKDNIMKEAQEIRMTERELRARK